MEKSKKELAPNVRKYCSLLIAPALASIALTGCGDKKETWNFAVVCPEKSSTFVSRTAAQSVSVVCASESGSDQTIPISVYNSDLIKQSSEVEHEEVSIETNHANSSSDITITPGTIQFDNKGGLFGFGDNSITSVAIK